MPAGHSAADQAASSYFERRQAVGRDPSEADVAVLERLRSADEPLDERERAVAIAVDSARPVLPTALARSWLDAP